MNIEKAKIAVTWLVGGVLFISGLQFVLILPIHLFDVYFLNWSLWPGMTMWKGVLILLVGIVLMIAGGELSKPGEEEFFGSTGGDEL